MKLLVIKLFKNTILIFINSLLVLNSFFFDIKRGKIVYVPVNFNLCGNAFALLKAGLRRENLSHVYLCEAMNSASALENNENILFCRFSLKFLYHYSTAAYVVREAGFDSFGLFTRKGTKVVQLWHAAGAFKKFGLDSNFHKLFRWQRTRDAKRWDLLLCSSNSVVDIYSRACGDFDKNKIYVGGLPRNDLLYELSLKEEYCRKKYCIDKSVKIILYAPTFRDWTDDHSIFVKFIEYLTNNLSGEYKLAVRLHPSIHEKNNFDNKVLDLSSCHVEEAMIVSDMLITDYSSIIFDYALLNKLMLFYAPDLAEYYSDRGFYYEYRNFVPGPIGETAERIFELIYTSNYDTYGGKIDKFREEYNPFFDGKNSVRLLNKILSL